MINDLPEAVFVQDLDVPLDEHFEKPALARQPLAVPDAALLVTQDGEVHAQGVQDARQLSRDFLVARFEGWVTLHDP